MPEPGQLIHLRQRRRLVEAVEEARLGEATLVHAACVDDDAQGEPVSVLWDTNPLGVKGAGEGGIIPVGGLMAKCSGGGIVLPRCRTQ
jgi:hypothetical protein